MFEKLLYLAFKIINKFKVIALTNFEFKVVK